MRRLGLLATVLASLIASAAGADERTQPLLLVLRGRNPLGLERFIAAPRRHWLDPHEFGRRFGASPRSLRRAARWLRARGLRVRHRFADRTLIQFDGPPAAVAAAFDVRLGRAHGRFRSSRPPLLPAELGALDVLGLDGARAAPRFTVGPAARTAGNRFYISPADFRHIYGLDAPAVASLSGAGQRISIPAIGDADGDAVANFRAFFGLPPDRGDARCHLGGCRGAGGADRGRPWDRPLPDSRPAGQRQPRAGHQHLACGVQLARRAPAARARRRRDLPAGRRPGPDGAGRVGRHRSLQLRAARGRRAGGLAARHGGGRHGGRAAARRRRQRGRLRDRAGVEHGLDGKRRRPRRLLPAAGLPARGNRARRSRRGGPRGRLPDRRGVARPPSIAWDEVRSTGARGFSTTSCRARPGCASAVPCDPASRRTAATISPRAGALPTSRLCSARSAGRAATGPRATPPRAPGRPSPAGTRRRGRRRRGRRSRPG
ncbi:MAG: hypothetical protein E6J70_07925 [Deltaproteobacteria bacterium]|nr:MAG: hypothetical protein E6J70_07925 [Deltaproteobacteria bacterium]